MFSLLWSEFLFPLISPGFVIWFSYAIVGPKYFASIYVHRLEDKICVAFGIVQNACSLLSNTSING